VSESPTLHERRFRATDGTALVGDLARPHAPVMAAIICHPHPMYGGDRFNHVVTAVFEALPRARVAALRFDFRSEFSGGPGERLDAIAAIDDLAAAVPGVPIVAVGYSFGALIALGLDDDRVGALGLIAPPLAMAPHSAAPTVPALVLTPRHDQFSPPSKSDPIVSAWHDQRDVVVEHHTIEMADHSLIGQTRTVVDEITTWLTNLP
jgi:hypothetical protein